MHLEAQPECFTDAKVLQWMENTKQSNHVHTTDQSSSHANCLLQKMIRKKKNVKKGIQFCLMVCGASGTGTFSARYRETLPIAIGYLARHYKSVAYEII